VCFLHGPFLSPSPPPHPHAYIYPLTFFYFLFSFRFARGVGIGIFRHKSLWTVNCYIEIKFIIICIYKNIDIGMVVTGRLSYKLKSQITCVNIPTPIIRTYLFLCCLQPDTEMYGTLQPKGWTESNNIPKLYHPFFRKQPYSVTITVQLSTFSL
jgi:hypothetical protein